VSCPSTNICLDQLGSCEYYHSMPRAVDSAITGLGSQALDSKQDRKVPLLAVERLSVYRKALEELHSEGLEFVHSHQLAEHVGVTPAQLRRDLASFGSFGNIARGYNVYQLTRTISRILGTDTPQTVALFGVGDLGRSLLAYKGFEERGFHIGVVFDLDAEKAGRVFAGRRCYSLEDIERVLTEFSVRIAVLASRPEGLQRLVDRLGNAGVKLFLNFVPKRVSAPPGGHVEYIDIAAKLEKLSFIGRH
jgi:redox-sensing transcriptional repressor